jgi:hypothetical protein
VICEWQSFYGKTLVGQQKGYLMICCTLVAASSSVSLTSSILTTFRLLLPGQQPSPHCPQPGSEADAGLDPIQFFADVDLVL